MQKVSLSTMASPACREQVMRAPESLVKEVLLALCEDKDVEKTALERLDALTKSSGASRGLGRKRKATDDLAICAHLRLLSCLNPRKVCRLSDAGRRIRSG